jgi:hypothetical protein
MRSLGMAVVLALCFAPALQAQAPFDFKDFSATMSGALSGPDFETKIYRKGDLIRVDMPGHFIVTDVNSLTSYGYFPRTNSCLQNSAPQSGSIPFSMLKNARIERQSVPAPAGEDKVDGHPCKVEEVTLEHEGRPPVKLKVWEAQDLGGFPIKIVRENQRTGATRTLFYRDVQLGPPDASLFARPADCGASAAAPASMSPAPEIPFFPR